MGLDEQLGRWQIRGVSWLEFLDGIGKGLVGLLGPSARVTEFLQGGLRVWS